MNWYTAAVAEAPRFLASLAGAIALVVAFWVAAVAARRLVPLAFTRAARGHEDVGRMLGTLTYVALLTFGVVSAIGTLGVNVSALVAGLGLTGFALGFALRDTISNALAGTMLMIYRPFRAGDRIAVAGSEGKVIEVDLRYTILDAGDRLVLVPNAKLISEIVFVYRRPRRQDPDAV